MQIYAIYMNFKEKEREREAKKQQQWFLDFHLLLAPSQFFLINFRLIKEKICFLFFFIICASAFMWIWSWKKIRKIGYNWMNAFFCVSCRVEDFIDFHFLRICMEINGTDYGFIEWCKRWLNLLNDTQFSCSIIFFFVSLSLIFVWFFAWEKGEKRNENCNFYWVRVSGGINLKSFME